MSSASLHMLSGNKTSSSDVTASIRMFSLCDKYELAVQQQFVFSYQPKRYFPPLSAIAT